MLSDDNMATQADEQTKEENEFNINKITDSLNKMLYPQPQSQQSHQ